MLPDSALNHTASTVNPPTIRLIIYLRSSVKVKSLFGAASREKADLKVDLQQGEQRHCCTPAVRSVPSSSPVARLTFTGVNVS